MSVGVSPQPMSYRKFIKLSLFDQQKSEGMSEDNSNIRRISYTVVAKPVNWSGGPAFPMDNETSQIPYLVQM